MSPSTPLITTVIQKPLFNTTFVNVDYYFNQVLVFWRWLHTFTGIAPSIYFVSYILSLFGITMIIYCLVRMVEIYIEENGHLKHAIAEYAERHNEAAGGTNERWTHIQDLVNSPNQAEWRLSIIEADSVLEGLLQARDIPGDSIGAQLKNISPGDLGSIQAAWEAHLVRNRIAHEGSEFDLSQHDARRAIQLYEVVFRELGFL